MLALRQSRRRLNCQGTQMKTSYRVPVAVAISVFSLTMPVANAAIVSQDAVKAEAKVAEVDARKTALAKVENGTVQSSALEKEHGRLVWSFDIAQPTTKDLTEVQVDATTGAIASVTKETPSQEAKEMKR